MNCGSVCTTRDGSVIVSGHNWVACFDMEGNQRFRPVNLPQMLNAITVADSNGMVAAAVAGEGGLRVWDADFGEIHPRDSHYGSVTQLTFLKNDSLIASAAEHPDEVMCWDRTSGRRRWARSFGDIWCDGLMTHDEQLLIATSTAENTKLVLVNPTTAETVAQTPIACGFRAAVTLTDTSEMALAPSWAYGPGGKAAIAQFPSGNRILTLTGGEYGLAPVAANHKWIVSSDQFHIWIWNRDTPDLPRDLPLPEESEWGLNPVRSIIFDSPDSFIVLANRAAYRFSGPVFRSSRLTEFEAAPTAASRPVEGVIALGFKDGHAELRTLPRFELMREWESDPGWRIDAVALGKDVSLVATGSSSGLVAVWELNS